MIPLIDTYLEPALWLLADWSLRWAVLIALLAVWLVAFRPRRAASRYLVCWVVLVAGLVLPTVPRWGTGFAFPAAEPVTAIVIDDVPAVPVTAAPLPEAKDSPSPSTPKIEPVISEPTVDHSPPVEASVPPVASLPVAERLGTKRTIILGLALLWTAGVFLLLARRVGGWLLLERMRRAAIPLAGAAVKVFETSRADLGLRRPVSLAAHPMIRSPITLGLFRPAILVPPSWPELPFHVQRGSLLHELAHLARYDDWSALGLEVVRVFFFFHPLVHWLIARLECERELLCDETAIARGVDPRDFARMLLEFSRQAGRLLPTPCLGPSYPVRFGKRRTVKMRIHQLLEENMSRFKTPLLLRRAIVLGIVVFGLALALGSLRVRASANDEPKSGDDENKALAPVKKVPSDAEKQAPAVAKKPSPKKRPYLYDGKIYREWQDTLAADLSPRVRREAIKALGAFGVNGYGEEAAAAIVEALRGYDVAAQDDDLIVINEATTALRKIGPEAVPALVDELKNGKRNGRRFAVFALTSFKRDAQAAVPTLIGATKDKDPYVRRNAINALENIDKQAKDSVPAIAGALKDEDIEVRVVAAQALARIGPKAEAAVPGLLAALKDENSQIRQVAVGALRNIKPDAKTVLADLIEAIKDEDQNTRVSVYGYLGTFGPKAKEAVPALLAALKDANGNERYFIADSLGSIGAGAKEAIPTLSEMLNSDDPRDQQARQAVSQALKKIAK